MRKNLGLAGRPAIACFLVSALVLTRCSINPNRKVHTGFILAACLILFILSPGGICDHSVQDLPAAKPGLDIQSFAVPGRSWAFEMALPAGLTVEGSRSVKPPATGKAQAPDAKAAETAAGAGLKEPLVFLRKDPNLDWLLRLSFSLAPPDSDAKTERSKYRKQLAKSPLPYKNFKSYELNGASVLEDEMKDSRFMIMGSGEALFVKTLSYFLVHDGVLIEIHLSKSQFKPSDQTTIMDILAGMKIVPLTE